MEKNKEKTIVRAVADYQLFGDVDGIRWMQQMLQQATTEGKLKDFEVLSSVTGNWGIRFVTFTVDAEIVPAQFENLKSILASWLNAIIGDSDVEVRWVGVP